LLYHSSSAMVALMIRHNLLYNCSCKRGDRIIVSCPMVLVALDHPVTVECPCWTIFQQGLSELLHLLCRCAWVDFWVTCVPLSIYRMLIDSSSCKPNSCYLVQTMITLFIVVIQAGPWSDWL
jgi:hypothetical protein